MITYKISIRLNIPPCSPLGSVLFTLFVSVFVIVGQLTIVGQSNNTMHRDSKMKTEISAKHEEFVNLK